MLSTLITHLDRIGISIIFPVIFIFCSVVLETISSLVNGIGRDNNKYIIWIEEESNGDKTIRSIPRQPLTSIISNEQIIEIESMFFFDIISFKSLGINLSTSAFAIDITSIVDGRANKITAYILVIHFVLLIIVLLATILCNIASPNELQEKKRYARSAIILGFVSMMLAYVLV